MSFTRRPGCLQCDAEEGEPHTTFCPARPLGSEPLIKNMHNPHTPANKKTAEYIPTPPEAKGIHEMLNERGKRYGRFSANALTAQQLKIIMRQHDNWQTLTSAQAEALEMIAHKIGRILNGDPNYKDSWVDIAGYATLVADKLED